MGRVAYRWRQFFRALEESRTPACRDLVDRYLDVDGRVLFDALSPRDQAHATRAAALLVDRGLENELITAALLHDAGKGRQRLWQRVAYVLLAATSPRLLRRLARPGVGWRGALDRSIRHPRIGAELARAAGYSETVCRLIAEHHRPPTEPDQRLLQWADEVA